VLTTAFFTDPLLSQLVSTNVKIINRKFLATIKLANGLLQCTYIDSRAANKKKLRGPHAQTPDFQARTSIAPST
jgi:hypothetical protein